MHAAGINHRDCYICHFLLHLPFSGKEEELKISVIDLHRAQLRTRVPRRWRDKDLIGLYFSSMNIGLTQRDIWRFMKVYFAAPLKDILKQEQGLLSQAEAKATKNRRLVLHSRPFPGRIQPEKGRPGRHPQNPSSVYFKHSLPVLPSAASGHPKIPPGSPSPSQPGSPGRWMRRAGPRYALQWQDPVPFLQWP